MAQQTSPRRRNGSSTQKAEPLRGLDIGKRGGAERWLLPFLIPNAAVPVLGAVMHAKSVGTPAHQWVPWFISAMSLMLAWLAYNYAGPRRKILRIHHAVSMLYIVNSLAVHTAIGPFSHWRNDTWPWLWILCGFAWAVSWLIPRFDTVRGKGDDEHNPASGIDDMLGIKGASAKRVATTAVREVWRVYLRDGMDAEHVQRIAKKIASIRKLAPGSVRVQQNRQRADIADVTILREDVLATPKPWPGPSNFGGSIAAPIVRGVYEDGDPVKVNLFGTKINNIKKAAPGTAVVVGLPGSGKTNGAKITAAEVMTRHDSMYWHGDPAKAQQFSRALRQRCDWYADNKADCIRMLAALDRLIPVRSAILGDEGLEEWQEGCSLVALAVNMEEASRFLGSSDEYVQLTQACRSVGIFLVVSMQRASATMFDTDARHNMGMILCYGTGDPVSASMVLDESVTDAGVDPAMWRNDWPGRLVLQAPSVDRERWVIEARDYEPTEAQLQMWMDRADNEIGTVRLTEREVQALGTVYTKRGGKTLQDKGKTSDDGGKTSDDTDGQHAALRVILRDEDGHRDFTERATAKTASPVETIDSDDDVSDDVQPYVMDFSDLSPEDQELIASSGGGSPLEPIDTDIPEGLDVNYDDLMPDGPPLPLDQRKPAFGRMLAAFLTQAGGVACVVSAGDLADAWAEIPGVTRASLSRLINRAVEAEAMSRNGYGSYIINPGADRLFLQP